MSKTNGQAPATNSGGYDIRDRLSVLSKSKASKTKYHCPVCQGDDLDIDPRTGAYHCFSNECSSQDIRAAIDRLEGKPEWKPEQDNWVKPVRPKSKKEYFYPDRNGKPLVKVTRIDDGNGGKKFYQSHWDGGKWVKGNPDEVKKLIPIYRRAEVLEAIERGELVFFLEGEAAVDAAWELGIPATTTIGGAGKFSAYGDYTTDLEGGQFVLTPDRDAVGVKHMGQIAEFLGDRVTGYYLAGSPGLWKKPEGGMDIGNDIRDLGLTKEQILAKIVSPVEYQEATALVARFASAPKAKPPEPVSKAEEPDYKSLAERLGIAVVRDGDGKIGSKLVRLTLDLFHLVGDRLKLNLMTQDYEYKGKPLDLNHIKNFISQNLGYDSSTENCIQAVHAIADKFAYHPVGTYLDSLRGRVDHDFEVLNNIATLFLGNSDPLANKMMAKSMIGAVARVKEPGTKVDTLTVLQGGQGFFKSTFLRVLAGLNWFCDDIRDTESKDELAKLVRYWIIELAEVDYLMGRKEVECFKRFLSSTADTYRPPYGRANIQHERTCAFFATTNKTEFLKDPTGSRRYWVVKVGCKIDCELVAKFRDIIWATAVAAYEQGDTWWLDDADEATREESSEEFRDPDPWEETIKGLWKSIPIADYKGCERVEIDRIFETLNLDNDKRNKLNRNRIAAILKVWGFESKTINTDEGKVKAWLRPKVGEVGAEDLPPTDDELKNKVLQKYPFLGSSNTVTNSQQGFKLELILEPNSSSKNHENSSQQGLELELISELISNEETVGKKHQNGFQQGTELELISELVSGDDDKDSVCSFDSPANLELISRSEISSKLDLCSESVSAFSASDISSSFLEISSSSNAFPEPISPPLEPVEPKKTAFKDFEKNDNKLKVGDRVRYIGGMVKYQGQSGQITRVSGGNFETTFTTRSHGSIPAAELEVIAA